MRQVLGMILNEKKQARFFRIRDSLISYADEKLGVTGWPVPPSQVRRMMVQEDLLLVTQAIFEHREVIDGFIEDNPARLNDQMLADAAAWKEALAENAVLAAFPDGKERFIVGDYGFEVCGLSVPPTRMVEQERPAIAWIAMLPYDGRIVHAGVVGEQKLAFGKGALKAFEVAAVSIYEEGRIARTPADLADAAASIRKAQADRVGEHSLAGVYEVK